MLTKNKKRELFIFFNIILPLIYFLCIKAIVIFINPDLKYPLFLHYLMHLSIQLPNLYLIIAGKGFRLFFLWAIWVNAGALFFTGAFALVTSFLNLEMWYLAIENVYKLSIQNYEISPSHP